MHALNQHQTNNIQINVKTYMGLLHPNLRMCQTYSNMHHRGLPVDFSPSNNIRAVVHINLITTQRFKNRINF